jgi:hypothetical protein
MHVNLLAIATNAVTILCAVAIAYMTIKVARRYDPSKPVVSPLYEVNKVFTFPAFIALVAWVLVRSDLVWVNFAYYHIVLAACVVSMYLQMRRNSQYRAKPPATPGAPQAAAPGTAHRSIVGRILKRLRDSFTGWFRSRRMRPFGASST